jgi:hypothetical protein
MDFVLVEVLEVDQQFERRPALPSLDLELLMVFVDRMSRAFDRLMRLFEASRLHVVDEEVALLVGPQEGRFD